MTLPDKSLNLNRLPPDRLLSQTMRFGSELPNGQWWISTKLFMIPNARIARSIRGSLEVADTSLLRVAEGPNLVALDTPGLHIAYGIIVIGHTSVARVNQ